MSGAAASAPYFCSIVFAARFVWSAAACSQSASLCVVDINVSPLCSAVPFDTAIYNATLFLFSCHLFFLFFSFFLWIALTLPPASGQGGGGGDRGLPVDSTTFP